MNEDSDLLHDSSEEDELEICSSFLEEAYKCLKWQKTKVLSMLNFFFIDNLNVNLLKDYEI